MLLLFFKLEICIDSCEILLQVSLILRGKFKIVNLFITLLSDGNVVIVY